MNNDELINAINIIKNYCFNNKDCSDCILGKSFECTVYKMYAPYLWDISAPNVGDTPAERIAELHREVDIRDRYIEELKQELSIKDGILDRQGVKIAKLEETQFVWHPSHEDPPTSGIYLCYFRDKDNTPGSDLYGRFIYHCNAWGHMVPEDVIFVAWAKIPRYGETNNARN